MYKSCTNYPFVSESVPATWWINSRLAQGVRLEEWYTHAFTILARILYMPRCVKLETQYGNSLINGVWLETRIFTRIRTRRWRFGEKCTISTLIFSCQWYNFSSMLTPLFYCNYALRHFLLNLYTLDTQVMELLLRQVYCPPRPWSSFWILDYPSYKKILWLSGRSLGQFPKDCSWIICITFRFDATGIRVETAELLFVMPTSGTGPRILLSIKKISIAFIETWLELSRLSHLLAIATYLSLTPWFSAQDYFQVVGFFRKGPSKIWKHFAKGWIMR